MSAGGQNRSSAVMQQRSEPHEEWRKIDGWPGYEVSDQGRVRSWKQRSRTQRRTWVIDRTREPRVLRPCKRNGYPSVLLIRDGDDRQWFSVHRLVLSVFVGPPPHDHEGAHRDGDRTNNRLSNLRWATHGDNEADKIGHGTRLRGALVGSSKLTSADVQEIRRARSAGEKVLSLAGRFGVCRNTITNITTGKSWADDYLEQAPALDVAGCI